MNNVLITGGSGFIGSWLARHPRGIIVPLNRQGYEQGEWMDKPWRYIIHLAPMPVNAVIACARRCGATVLLASSGGVYDREPSAYFKMKLEDERKLAESGLDYRIARIFTTCGAFMKWQRYAIGNFIMQAEQGRIEVQSFGAVVRSYMYGSDLAEWLWKILQDGEPSGFYNVGSDVPHSTAELAFEIATHFDPPPQVHLIPRMQHEPRPFYVPDVTRARDELGLEIKIPYQAAVRLTVGDYRREN